LTGPLHSLPLQGEEMNTEQHWKFSLAKENVKLERGMAAFIRLCTKLKSCAPVFNITSDQIHAQLSGEQIETVKDQVFENMIMHVTQNFAGSGDMLNDMPLYIPLTADSSQCRDSCVNGICVVNECFCDIGFTNPTLEGCSEWSKPQFECSLEPLEDRCMEYGKYGRLTAFSPERVKLSSECEVNFWKNVEVPHRNKAQLIFMRYFKDLPKHLGHILELGSGPYTKLRLLLQEGQVTRTMEDISSVTLEDPLLLRYIQEAKSTSLNYAGQLCLEATPSWDPRVIDQVSGEKIDHSCVPTIIANFGAEHPKPLAC